MTLPAGPPDRSAQLVFDLAHEEARGLAPAERQTGARRRRRQQQRARWRRTTWVLQKMDCHFLGGCHFLALAF